MTTENQSLDNLRCLYAEDIFGAVGDKTITRTIALVRQAPQNLFCASGETAAWDIIFETDKPKRPYIQIPFPNVHGKATIMLRQYVNAMGGDPSPSHVGRKIALYTVPSRKSATGRAIRIASAESSKRASAEAAT